MAAFDWRNHFTPFLDYLNGEHLLAWASVLTGQLVSRFEDNPHGDMARWQAALDTAIGDDATVDLNTSAVTCRPEPLSPEQAERLEQGLRGLMPWRKGPFEFFGTHIDTEWRSDWKWDRVAPHLADLNGRTILDVGCGSGYHCWRMAGAGARRVVGIDPGLLFMFQFLAVKGYLDNVPVDLLPVRMEDLPENLELFDTTFSMGVLYHRRRRWITCSRRQPATAANWCWKHWWWTARRLQPDAEDRYGQMRNVWFQLPHPAALADRTGFRNARVVDVSDTTTDEQRSTDWMRFNSLKDFLDPDDPRKPSKATRGQRAPSC